MRGSLCIMNVLNKIVVTLRNPEQNGLNASTKLTSDSIYKTYIIMNGEGECIEATYKGIKCLPKIVLYDTNYAVIEITQTFLFFIKLTLKEYVDKIS